MGPLAHDFWRTLRSKSVILSMALVILLSLALVPFVNLAASPVTGNGGVVSFGYYSSPEYHALAYSYNTFGQPVQGTAFNLTVTDPSGTHGAVATTNSSGFARMDFPGDPPSGSTSYVLRAGAFGIGGDIPVSGTKGGVFGLTGSPISFVQDPSNSSRLSVLFVYEGDNGTVPSAYTLYYNFTSTQGQGNVNPSPENMHLLGVPHSFASTWKLPQLPSGTNTVTVGAFAGNGSIGVLSSYSSQSIGGGFTPPTPGQLFTAFTSGILVLIAPLMAILVAYNSYGKDRTSGVLESILVRPVTRRGVGLTRYLSIVVALSAALFVTMGVMEIISQMLLGTVVPASFAASTVLSLIVESAAFVGLTMLIAQLLRSSGALVGAGIVLWVVLDFFWGVIILVAAAAFGIQIGSGNYLALSIQSGFFNPAQFYSLVGTYLNGASITSAFGSSVPISPATYGLTVFTLALDGALWVLLPLGAFLYVVARRD